MLYLKKIEKNTWKYHYFTPVHQKAWWSDLQFLRYWVKLVIMGHFCTPLTCTTTTILNTTTTTTTTTTPSNPKKQNFEKMEKLLEISSFYTCVPKTTITWAMVLQIQSETDFMSFLAIFSPFTTLKTQKINTLKKRKKYLEMSSFYTSWDMECDW